MSNLSLSLLGSFSASLDGQQLTPFRTKSVQALLIYLVCEAKQAHQRETLMDLLWPGMPLASAQNNMRQTLYRLRQAIPEVQAKEANANLPFLLTDRQSVQINPRAAYEVDVHLFADLAQHDPAQAIALYRGDFLQDFYLPDSETFEEWVNGRRAHHQRQVLNALDEVTAVHLQNGRYDAAEKLARQQLTLDNLRESGHRQLMEALAGNGRRRAALSHYESLSQLLQAELDIEPSAETQALVQAIRAGELSGKHVEREEKGEEREEKSAEPEKRPSPIAPLPSPPHNLPPQATPFIGRSTELAALDNFLAAPAIRLVTIVGAGGMGKTRLALAAAERYLVETQNFASLQAFPHGVFLVNLAPLNEAEQMVSAVADVLNFPLQGGDDRSPQQQILDYLRHKQMLLLFDNFEHLLVGASLVNEILKVAPEVQILVTSRERLHLRSEQVYPIEGLEFPDWETPKDAERYTAVQLFLQSARRNQPDFALRNDADLTHLARICRLVAGMPLALELAAAWVDMLPLAEIAAGLQQGLDFLETDMRDVPERHRSVRAAIDYSWHKLTEQERDIFAKLSVFRGGFTRQAAQAVAGANLRQLGRLVNKSFLQYAQASDRYQVHELMRKYGLEKLQESDQEAEVRDQHSRFFCNALQEWQTGLDSSQMRQTAAEIEADYPNVLVAWEFALVQGHHKRLVSVVNVLGTYFDVNGRWLEGIKLFQESLKLLQTTPGLLTTEAAVRLGIWLSSWWGYLVFVGRTNFAEFHFVYQHILPSGLELLEHPLLSGVDSRAEEAFLRLQLAYALVIDAPRIEEGRAHLTIAIRLYQELGNLSGFADALGIIYFYYTDREMLLKTQEQLQEILVSLRQQNQPRQLILTLRNLGQMDRGLKAYDKMIDHLNEAYTIAQLSGDVIKMIETRNLTINILYNLGYFDLALEYSEELLTVAEQTHSTNHKALAFSLVGAAQVYRGQFLLAIEILQEAIRYDNENVPSSGEEVISLWVSVGLPQAYLHTGQYEKALAWITNRRPEWHLLAYQTWIPLIQEVYEETLALAQQSLALLSTPHRVGQPEIFTPEALALYQLGRIHEAKARLHLSLQICLEIRESFLQLMALIPVIARVLTDGEDAGQKERAVELWAMAQALPFVGNSQLFADLLSQPLAKAAAELPAEVVAAAQVRGQELDWWQTAETLLTELTELGWNKQTD